jgi:hypothetical protein
VAGAFVCRLLPPFLATARLQFRKTLNTIDAPGTTVTGLISPFRVVYAVDDVMIVHRSLKQVVLYPVRLFLSECTRLLRVSIFVSPPPSLHRRTITKSK